MRRAASEYAVFYANDDDVTVADFTHGHGRSPYPHALSARSQHSTAHSAWTRGAIFYNDPPAPMRARPSRNICIQPSPPSPHYACCCCWPSCAGSSSTYKKNHKTTTTKTPTEKQHTKRNNTTISSR